MQRADRQPSAGSTSPTAPGKSLATEAEAAAEAEDLQHRAAWLVEMRSAGHEVDARGFLVDVRGNRVVDPQGCFVNAQVCGRPVSATLSDVAVAVSWLRRKLLSFLSLYVYWIMRFANGKAGS